MSNLFTHIICLIFLVFSTSLPTFAFTPEIQSYEISHSHKAKKKLDRIFTKHPYALESPKTITAAGFKILHRQPKSRIVVLKHPEIKGYVIKAYLSCDINPNWTTTTWQRLVNRCIGAENIRKLIKKKKIKYFTVPEKQLYVVPSMNETVILLATDMRLVSNYDNHFAWKKKITKDHLKELYLILSHGYSSCYLQENIPYTKDGTFACVDTEHPQRQLNLNLATRYFSEKMQAYWLKLIE